MAQNGTAHANSTSEILPFDKLDSSVQTLLRKAVDAREFAYCPYSKFKVGACVELENGEMITGCNVENASFTVGTCAERCALIKAISEGKRKYKRVAVVAHQENAFTTPCGACRQFMSEFGEFEVFLARPELKTVLKTSVMGLLPLNFQINDDYTF